MEKTRKSPKGSNTRGSNKDGESVSGEDSGEDDGVVIFLDGKTRYVLNGSTANGEAQ